MLTRTAALVAAAVLLGAAMPAQTQQAPFATLYDFQSGGGGFLPLASVTIGENEKLYGTTVTGGSGVCAFYPGNACGTAFAVTPPSRAGGAWSLATIYNFQSGAGGTNPIGNLVPGERGEFYGVATGGGSSSACPYGCGTVFRLSPPAGPGGGWTETVLYAFQNGTDGAFPTGGLAMGAGGQLYGITTGGGSNGQGTVYELTPPEAPGQSWKETVLHRFDGGSGGVTPYGGVVVGPGGAIYGVTVYGGVINTACVGVTAGCGTVFQLKPPSSVGGSWRFQVIYDFLGGNDGESPQSRLVMGRHGEIYGATSYGGSVTAACPFGCGAVFSLTPPPAGGNWQESVLHAFAGVPDGSNPSGLLMDPVTGALLGATMYGGDAVCNCGTVFRMAPPAAPGGTWLELVVHTFRGGLSGSLPFAPPVLDKNGVLYGTTELGGAGTTSSECCGTIFALNL